MKTPKIKGKPKQGKSILYLPISEFLKKYTKDLFVPPKKQVPVLDGIRAAAILLVVGFHSNLHILRADLQPAIFAGIPPFQGGWVGVPLFFILSGYFIGSQLWREFDRTGTIKVLRFILRRGLRIWPLYYFILIISYVFFREYSIDFWSNVFFVANYLGDAGPIRGAWSLSTQEQFYILIPTFIFLLAKLKSFKTLGDYRKLFYALLFLPPLSRTLTWYYLTGFEFYDVNLYVQHIYRPIHTHFDGLIVGLLFSNIRNDKSFEVPHLLKSHWIFLGLCIGLGMSLKLTHKVVFTYSALAIMFGSFIWMVIHRDNIITRFLSWRPFYWMAKVSFGVYIVHHLVLWTLDDLGWFSKTIVNPEFHLLATFFVTFSFSCLICSVTYVLVEAPFIDFRNLILKNL